MNGNGVVMGILLGEGVAVTQTFTQHSCDMCTVVEGLEGGVSS